MKIENFEDIIHYLKDIKLRKVTGQSKKDFPIGHPKSWMPSSLLVRNVLPWRSVGETIHTRRWGSYKVVKRQGLFGAVLVTDDLFADNEYKSPEEVEYECWLRHG